MRFFELLVITPEFPFLDISMVAKTFPETIYCFDTAKQTLYIHISAAYVIE